MKKQKQRRFLALLLVIALAISFMVPVIAHAAEEDNGYGNEWVYDEARVVSPETEDYIKSLNEEIFAHYANKPQLAFIVLDNLPYNMDDYKLDMFNEYGVGTKVENHGMLFVFAINDREYGLEIGDGFTKGSILRKDLETDFITEDMKNSLRAGDYDTVVYQVAEHLAGLMADEENLVYAQKEEAAAAKRAEEEAAAAIRHAQFEAATPWIIGGGLGLLALGSVAYVIAQILAARKKERQYEELEQRYFLHFKVFRDKESEAKAAVREKLLNTEYGCDDIFCFEAEFTRYLYELYLKYSRTLLEEMGKAEYLGKYLRQLEIRNSYNAFVDLKLASLDNIVKTIDQEEEDKKITYTENTKRVQEFWDANKARVENKVILSKLELFMQRFRMDHRLVSKAELERSFVGEMQRLNFEYECDRFCKENADLIKSRDFNRSQFYRELACSSNGSQYRYSPTYNNFWMRHYLISHMSSQRKLREQREAEERRKAQRRRAEAQRQAQRRNNASFGTSFRGGFSSGGGFKGGW